MILDVPKALKIAIGLLLAALLLKGSLLAALLAAAASAPSAYVMWMGQQEEASTKTYAIGLSLFLGSLVAALVLFLVWLF
jgi:hypothetical protein